MRLRILLIAGLCSGLSASGCAADPALRERFRAIEDYVRAYHEMAAFDGVVLIAEGDEIVYRKAFGQADYEFGVPMEADARFHIASLSKDITTAAIGRLVDRGLVSLDAALSDYLPEFPNAGKITILQLIEHRSGVPHTNNLAWMDMTEAMTLPEIVARLAEEPLDFAPGEKRRYSNGGYALLAAVIEAASQKSYGAFLREEFAGYPSIGHKDAYEVVPGLAERYAPGPRYGERARATTYLVANRIGGGSLYANAEDLFRFFRDAYYGDLVSAETRAELFPLPDGRAQVTGRAPGALAQLSFEPEGEVMLISLSSNSAWPASFNRDLLRLYLGEDVELAHFALAQGDRSGRQRRIVGDYFNERFDWRISIELTEHGLVFVQDELRTALSPTAADEHHLPVYDWLCALSDNADILTCRQRDPDADIRFVFNRVSSPRP